MTLVVPNGAEADGLSYFLNKSAPEDLVLRLFTNNITPAEADVAASYVEPAGFGYAGQALTAASWVITQGAPSSAAYPQVSFIFTGAAGLVYGYFVTRASSGRLAWAERFTDGPYTIATSGDAIRVTPQLTLE